MANPKSLTKVLPLELLEVAADFLEPLDVVHLAETDRASYRTLSHNMYWFRRVSRDAMMPLCGPLTVHVGPPPPKDAQRPSDTPHQHPLDAACIQGTAADFRALEIKFNVLLRSWRKWKGKRPSHLIPVTSDRPSADWSAVTHDLFDPWVRRFARVASRNVRVEHWTNSNAQSQTVLYQYLARGTFDKYVTRETLFGQDSDGQDVDTEVEQRNLIMTTNNPRRFLCPHLAHHVGVAWVAPQYDPDEDYCKVAFRDALTCDALLSRSSPMHCDDDKQFILNKPTYPGENFVLLRDNFQLLDKKRLELLERLATDAPDCKYRRQLERAQNVHRRNEDRLRGQAAN